MNKNLSALSEIKEFYANAPRGAELEMIIVDRTAPYHNNRSFVPSYYARIQGITTDRKSIHLWDGEGENEALLREKSHQVGTELGKKYGCGVYILKD